MKSDHDAAPSRPEARPMLMAGATMSVELLGPALAEFPDPVVVTNRDREVVFLNHAAQKLFEGTLASGDPCPFCGEKPLFDGAGKGASRFTQCPELGESLREVPMALKAHWPVSAPLNLTVTPIRGPDNRKAGCFMLIRESAELLAHPVMAQQMAILSSLLVPNPFF